MKVMETVQDLIEEAKLRTVYWVLCIFAVSYFLTHTSKSMWMNVPIAILLVCGLRILFNEVEFRWKVHNVGKHSYLSFLEKKQLSINDSRLSNAPPPPKWKRKIDSVIVESALNDFVDKILHDFVIDLWYGDITPDKEAPELIRAVIMDVLGEISGRVKDINLIDLLTRDVIDLIGDHLDIFRRIQKSIGTDVMGTLSSEERDERLKHHLLASKELHPALISSECEYKVLQRLMGGVLATVLRPREAQCPLVRCIARELLTCLVMEPLMNIATPAFINELIEEYVLANKEEGGDVATTVEVLNQEHVEDNIREVSEDMLEDDESAHSKPADWARKIEAATQRRTEVLTPENLENLWTKGRNYKEKLPKSTDSAPLDKPSSRKTEPSIPEDKALVQFPNRTRSEIRSEAINTKGTMLDGLVDASAFVTNENRSRLKKSNSTSDLTIKLKDEDIFSNNGGPFISEFYTSESNKLNDLHGSKSSSDMVLRTEGHVPKLRCRVIGAYFEKLGSKSFAVYSIAVTDANNTTWFVKRRYRNFERLHRHLKDIPNYTLHLPPKRIFSSSTEDAFVHQRCIQLDKYLQELLSIANVAEQHEVWDFLSVTSKNYSFGKSASVMKTLAVNVDDAVDDIVRQFRGVSDGLMKKVVGSPPSIFENTALDQGRNLSWNDDDINKLASRHGNSGSDEDGNNNNNNSLEVSSYTGGHASGAHSDNELDSRGLSPHVVKHDDESPSVHASSGARLESLSSVNSLMLKSDHVDAPMVPPEWTPPNLSVPILNLVDNMFQLKRRGWLRRQVFWISKELLQLMMEDAIDDWLIRQIHVLRREDIVAHGINLIQNILWPGGIFFTKLRAMNMSQSDEGPTGQSGGGKAKPGSFEHELEAARRASDVKKMIFDGAPSTLVSLIGHKQYRRCAKDIYYFIQSSICLKQLTYGILELLLISLFPELRDIVADIHEKAHAQPQTPPQGSTNHS